MHIDLNLFNSSFYLLLAKNAGDSLKSGFLAKKCAKPENCYKNELMTLEV